MQSRLITPVHWQMHQENTKLLASFSGAMSWRCSASCLVPSQPSLEPKLARIDIPITAAATLACIPVVLSQSRVTRVEGGLFVAAYVVYLLYLILVRA